MLFTKLRLEKTKNDVWRTTFRPATRAQNLGAVGTFFLKTPEPHLGETARLYFCTNYSPRRRLLMTVDLFNDSNLWWLWMVQARSAAFGQISMVCLWRSQYWFLFVCEANSGRRHGWASHKGWNVVTTKRRNSRKFPTGNAGRRIYK
jgi:hypothetical protein